MFTITPASPADIPEIARTLGEAFTGDTTIGHLVSPSSPTRDLSRLFSAMLHAGGLSRGRVDIARRDADGRLLGAAMWQPPGVGASLAAELRELPRFLRALGPQRLLAAARLQHDLDKHRPSEPHWYLAQIGSAEEARGTGVGSALLQHRLSTIDAADEAAYLESSNPRNRRLYERFGFTRVMTRDEHIDADATRMWRNPRSRASASH